MSGGDAGEAVTVAAMVALVACCGLAYLAALIVYLWPRKPPPGWGD